MLCKCEFSNLKTLGTLAFNNAGPGSTPSRQQPGGPGGGTPGGTGDGETPYAHDPGITFD